MLKFVNNGKGQKPYFKIVCWGEFGDCDSERTYEQTLDDNETNREIIEKVLTIYDNDDIHEENKIDEINELLEELPYGCICIPLESYSGDYPTDYSVSIKYFDENNTQFDIEVV